LLTLSYPNSFSRVELNSRHQLKVLQTAPTAPVDEPRSVISQYVNRYSNSHLEDIKPQKSPQITLKIRERKIETKVVVIKYLEYTQEIDTLMKQLSV
jgi:hypothetical protein